MKETSDVYTYEHHPQKSEWYTNLCDRFLSHMEQLTDEEIEAGIKEIIIDEQYFDQDTVELRMEVTVFVVTQ